MYSKKNRSLSPRHRSASPTNKLSQSRKKSTDNHSKYKYSTIYRRSIDNSCNEASSSGTKLNNKHKLESNECWKKSVNGRPSTPSDQQPSTILGHYIHQHHQQQQQQKQQERQQTFFKDKLNLDQRFFIQQNIKDPSGQTNTVNYKLDDPDNFQIIRRNDEGKTPVFKYLDEDVQALNAPTDKHRHSQSSSRLAAAHTSGCQTNVSRHQPRRDSRKTRSKSSSGTSYGSSRSKSSSSPSSSSGSSSDGERYSATAKSSHHSSSHNKHERRYKKSRKSIGQLKEKYKYRHRNHPTKPSSSAAASSSKNKSRVQYRPRLSTSNCRHHKNSIEKSPPHSNSPEKTPYFSNPVRERERIDRERRERQMLHNNLATNSRKAELSSAGDRNRQSRNFQRHGHDDGDRSDDVMLQYGLMPRSLYPQLQPIVLPPMPPQIVFVRPHPPPHMMRFPPRFHPPPPPPPGYYNRGGRPPPPNVPPPYYPYWCGPPQLPMPPPQYRYPSIRGQSSYHHSQSADDRRNSFERNNSRGNYKKS